MSNDTNTVDETPEWEAKVGDATYGPYEFDDDISDLELYNRMIQEGFFADFGYGELDFDGDENEIYIRSPKYDCELMTLVRVSE